MSNNYNIRTREFLVSSINYNKRKLRETDYIEFTLWRAYRKGEDIKPIELKYQKELLDRENRIRVINELEKELEGK